MHNGVHEVIFVRVGVRRRALRRLDRRVMVAASHMPAHGAPVVAVAGVC
jgi:hypothetical protein